MMLRLAFCRYLLINSPCREFGTIKYLQQANLNIIITKGQKISELTRKTNQKDINENSVVYKIPCSGGNLSYYGETGCGIQKRISQHKRDVRLHISSNSIVQHIEKENHLPKFEATEILHKGIPKKVRKALECALTMPQKFPLKSENP